MPSKLLPRTSGPVAFGVVFGLTLLLGAALGVTLALLDGAGDVDLLKLAGLSVAVMAVALAVGVWWWRQIDEAAREAHKWAWWWGGSGGLGLAAAVVIAVGYAHEALPAKLQSADPATLLSAGGHFVILCELVGYTVAWCVWWLRRM